MDMMLDVVVEPDLTWRWKDEDEFADLLDRGLVDAATGDRVRREGEAVIGRVEDRAAPFSEPWPGWRPDPAWCRPELRADWAVVQE
jgi:predicted RNA-binding protein associated with RNAse of E/G family